MANLFVNLPVPSTPGVGAPVLVAGIGPEKSFVIDGPMGIKAEPSGSEGVLSIEISNNGATYSPFRTIDLLADPEIPTCRVVAFAMRVRRLAGFSGPGTTLAVGGEATLSSLFTPLVVVGSGTGPGADVSAFGVRKTVSVSGNYVGAMVIEGSQNGGATYDPIITCDTGNSETFVFDGVWQLMRVRRIGSSVGSPTVSVGGHPMATGGGAAFNSCVLMWGGFQYVPMPNGHVPDPYITYHSNSISYDTATPWNYAAPVAGALSLFRVDVLQNTHTGTTTIGIVKNGVLSAQTVTVLPGVTGIIVTGGASVPFALNDEMAVICSVAGDEFGSEIAFTATALYTI
jgi:hypothetical protein